MTVETQLDQEEQLRHSGAVVKQIESIALEDYLRTNDVSAGVPSGAELMAIGLNENMLDAQSVFAISKAVNGYAPDEADRTFVQKTRGKVGTYLAHAPTSADEVARVEEIREGLEPFDWDELMLVRASLAGMLTNGDDDKRLDAECALVDALYPGQNLRISDILSRKSDSDTIQPQDQWDKYARKRIADSRVGRDTTSRRLTAAKAASAAVSVFTGTSSGRHAAPSGGAHRRKQAR